MNTLYPLKPNYKGKTKGWFVWLHHDTILEWSDNVKERIAYVRKQKPKNEQKVRAKHMIAVPDEMIPKYLKDANQKWRDADQKWEDVYKKREAAYQKFSCSPKLRKFLKENTPYSWDEDNKTLVY